MTFPSETKLQTPMKRFCIAILTLVILLLVLASQGQAQFRYQPGYQPRYQPRYQPSYQPRYQPRYPQGYRPVQPGYVPVRPQPVYRPAPGFGSAPATPNPNDRNNLRTQTGDLTTGSSTGSATQPNPDELSRLSFQNPSLELLGRLGTQKPALSDDKPYSKFPRLSGEFEPQRAMLLSISDLQPHHHGVLKELIAKTAGRLPLVILVNDKEQLKTAVELAESTNSDLSDVSFYVFKLDTIWLRDFGPRFLETESKPVSIDFYYDGTRPLDDQFPNKWGELAGIKNTTVEWTLQGGNLISNGEGLALTSTRFFEDNHVRFPFRSRPGNVEYERRKLVVDAFKTATNVDRLLFLRPLNPEATKHVDMFTTFLAPDHMLVARLDPRVDPANARILDENARFLQTIKVKGRPMRVDRIDIPARQDKYWSPYTNVIFANDLVLIPIYKSDSPALVSRAIQTYQRLLPGKEVDTIDMTTMQKLEGALHCLSINVPKFVNLPEGTLTAQQARQVVDGRLKLEQPKRLLINKNVREGRDPKPARSNRRSSNKPKSVTQAPALKKPAAVREPVMISGEIITGETKGTTQSTGPMKLTGSSNRQKTAPDPAKLAAAKTYRRVFVSGTGGFSLDAYAVALSRGKIHLMRTNDRRVVPVDIQKLSQEDQAWITANSSSIRTNGPLVERFISSIGN